MWKVLHCAHRPQQQIRYKVNYQMMQLCTKSLKIREKKHVLWIVYICTL